MENLRALLIIFFNIYFQVITCEVSFGRTSSFNSQPSTLGNLFDDDDEFFQPKFITINNNPHIEDTKKAVFRKLYPTSPIPSNMYLDPDPYGNLLTSPPHFPLDSYPSNPDPFGSFFSPPRKSPVKSSPSKSHNFPSSSSSSESSTSSSSDEEKPIPAYSKTKKKYKNKRPSTTVTTIQTTYSSSGFPSQSLPNPLLPSAPKVKPVPGVSKKKKKPERPSSNWALAGPVVAAGLAGGVTASALSKPKPAAKPTYPAQPLPANPVYTPFKCNYCIRPSCKPTITEYPNFNPTEDSDRLRKAVKGLGTDESTLIEILTSRSEEQVQDIVDLYHRHGPSLKEDIEGDTSFKFKKILLALITPLKFFYAEQLHKALRKGDSNTLIEIMTSLSPCAIREISSAYDLTHDRSLVDKISGSTYLNFKKFILALAKGNRDDNQQVDKAAARKDAEALINAGVKKWFGTDTSTFIEIFSTRSFPQLREVVNQYDELRKPASIEADISEEFHGKLENGLLRLVRNIKDQPSFFATELKDSLNGWLIPGPSNNEKLIRIMRGRCRIDLGDIQDAYNNLYSPKTLAKKVSDDTYFHYRKALLALLGPQISK